MLLLLIFVYFLGPKPAKPTFTQPFFSPASDLISLEKNIIETERQMYGLREGNAATILWADSTKKAKTKVAFLYLHGFGASHREGEPVSIDIAKQFGGNIFLARLFEHGIEKGEDNLLTFNAEDYYQSAEKALHVARQLGDSVVVLATSGGAAMSLFLASRHPEIKCLVTYSPAVSLNSGLTNVLAGHWGLQIARLVQGKNHNDWTFRNPKQRNFWTNHQRLESRGAICCFQKNTMQRSTFERVKCPVFLGYYYENEIRQDSTVSVDAMQEMFGQLGTPPQYKRAVSFPKAAAHVITSDLTTDAWQSVEAESVRFLKEVVGL
ncbi:MAG: alpha/beta hydrolase [Saprospiraceae bacterium]|nr:alpha/beta hydrolase [Saprospiraceae bacterium]